MVEGGQPNGWGRPAQWLRKASPMVEGGQPNGWGRPAQWLREASPMVEEGQPNGWGRPALWLRKASPMVEEGQPNGWGRPAKWLREASQPYSTTETTYALLSPIHRLPFSSSQLPHLFTVWWTHWAISRSSQCSTTGVTKAVVCAILSVGWCT